MKHLILALLIIMSNSNREKDSTIEEGICSLIPTQCSEKKQKKGVCCKIKGKNLYFPNFCKACLAVNIDLRRGVILLSTDQRTSSLHQD